MIEVDMDTGKFGDDVEISKWMQSRIISLGFKKNLWDQDSSSNVLLSFIQGEGPKTFTIVRKKNGILFTCSDTGHTLPSVLGIHGYFIRPNIAPLTPENISKEVQYGTFGKGLSSSSLDAYLKGVVRKHVTKNVDLSGQYHKVMTTLTDTIHLCDGKTVLYCPDIDFENSSSDVHQESQRIRILESLVIHWARQIKIAMQQQDDSSSTADDTGPLDEIEFWKIRANDLLGIKLQLESDQSVKIIQLLEEKKSNYVVSLQTIAQTISDRASEAIDNLKYLETIRELSITLRTCNMSDMKSIFPGFLDRLRLIWTYSNYYNSNDCVAGMLRKVSNEIIHRFREYISIEDILDGNIEACITRLKQAIQCGTSLKDDYGNTLAAIVRNKDRYAGRTWALDDSTLFAQLDAFLQRCKDLMDICDCQVQFARKSSATGGSPGPLPVFGGTKGNEIMDALNGIQLTFERLLNGHIRSLDYSALDVRVSRWYEDYSIFKGKIRDLEVMYENVIQAALEENASSIQEGVAIVETFHSMSRRPAIKKCVECKAVVVKNLYLKQVLKLRAEFDNYQSKPPLRIHEPQYSGSATWASSLNLLVEEGYKQIMRLQHLLSPKDRLDTTNACQSFSLVVKNYKMLRYTVWINHVESIAEGNGFMKRFENTLLRKLDNSSKSEIACNFDDEILSLFAEVNYWEKLQGEFSIPYYAHDICNRREQVRRDREQVMLVVRAYNGILQQINSEERRLFGDHLRKLNRHLSQGLNKLTWQSKGFIDMFVRDLSNVCAEVQHVIRDYQESKLAIEDSCKALSCLCLVRIDKNQVFESRVFERHQLEYKASMVARTESEFNNIVSLLRHIYRHFCDGTQETQREWKSQLAQIDKRVEQSLKGAVKKSLFDLSKAINGDSKTDPLTLFAVQIDLNENHLSYLPSMLNLTQSVNTVARDIVTTVSSVGRIRTQIYDNNTITNPDINQAEQAEGEETAGKTAEVVDDKYKRSYFDIISEDPDILKIVVQIMEGMSSTAVELVKYLSYWDKYRSLWELDIDSFIKKYAKVNRSLVQFDNEIQLYRGQHVEINGEAGFHSINFIRVDCNGLRQALMNHNLACQNKLTGLLNQNACTELRAIVGVFTKSRQDLTATPSNLDDLSAKINLTKEYKDIHISIRDKFEPVRETYSALIKYDVDINDEELQMLTTLDTSFSEFESLLAETQISLEKNKIVMKRDLENQIEAYSAIISNLRKESVSELPFGNNKSTQQALDLIKSYSLKIDEAKSTEASLSKGLSIFNLACIENKELVALSRDVELLAQIWKIRDNWEHRYEVWKSGQFNELNVEEMNDVIGSKIKKIGRLGKEMKGWGVWESMKSEIDIFRETLPLIQDLRSKAFRQRHWEQLQEKIGVDFDPMDAEFTLEKVVQLGFNQHKEFIGELSSNAGKELNIERAIQELADRWTSVELDIGSYKDKYFKLKSTEDLSQILEDDSVAISTMKASKFYASFKGDIDSWIKTLTIISEVVEGLLMVQRAWIYLENIFMAGGDIAKQLPQEFILFGHVNAEFSRVMTSLHNDPVAMRSCTADGMLPAIQKMDEDLERIQKCLDQYLEAKRMIFPRFYFLSDDDLLQILGQSKDPIAVQRHIKKCFEGIKMLKLLPQIGNRPIEATSMCSPDGELVSFAESVILDGPVELWLLQVEKAMRRGISKHLSIAIQGYKGKKDKWIKETTGQLLITTGSIVWTIECTRALTLISEGEKGALKKYKKKQVSYLDKLAEIIRGPLSSVDRNKVVALITMEIHNRDVIEKMVKANCNSVSDFEWLSQLRFMYLKDGSDFGKCEVRQTNSVLEYSNEYQGNNGRLVVTPLTDRCVLTLITAMYLNRGGNPLGPAGTGKTETVKDLGKNLAKYVVVTNCSDGMDYKSVGRIFSGLVQSGSWGCFDEFNRIKIEVISVVAMQIQSILTTMNAKLPSFSFMGATIPCNPNCGIFITMNPGYAGRTELPDNLKALMRPVAMMAPDLTMIAEVMLASEGFNDARNLAKKTVTLYSLMTQQLSKQDHYDYGLRNLKAVLNMAGQLKRGDPTMAEDVILMRALRDMNLPKFIKDDERLFRLLLGDLFPGLELPFSQYGALQTAIITELQKNNLRCHDFLIGKIFQFYDSRLTRHCNMLVGDTLGGKSTAWKTLAAAQTNLSNAGIEGFQTVSSYVINPKAIALNELYGAYDLQTFEWKDGILSTIFKACSEDERPGEKWILFDGPIDAMWCESLNSVMDDSKILTLINGDRIPLTKSMSLVFETQDLRVASPATVSRAGMIYIDSSELGWNTYVESWLAKKFENDEDSKALHSDFFDKWLTKVLKYKAANCVEPVKVSDFNAIMSLCALYDAFEHSEKSFNKVSLGENYSSVAEKVFVFCLAWSVGAAVNEIGRRLFSSCLSDIDSILPPTNTIYDYCVDLNKNEFVTWDSRVPIWRPTKGTTFHDMIVPTTDTVRNSFVVDTLIKFKKNVCLVGATGVGKTIIAQSILRDLPRSHSQLIINFSAATNSNSVQEIVEEPMEKRTKDKLGPIGGKKLVIFIDDFNMPNRTSHESPFQPPLELVRMLIDYDGWYDRSKCSWKHIVDTQLVVSMGYPGGGRYEISERTQSRFNLLNVTFPADNQITRIFDTILQSKFAEFDPEVKMLSTPLINATLGVYKTVLKDFLTTTEKFHYTFNVRDIARVVQGLLMATRSTIGGGAESVIRLWVHESQRVFADRFIRTKSNDDARFREILSSKLKEHLGGKEWISIMSDALEPKIGPVFCGLLTEGSDDGVPVYEEVCDYKRLRGAVEEKLENYNLEPKFIPMDLALFRDAVMHVCRIHRVLVQPRGNLLLVGIGGSGRSSLARLAAYCAAMTTFSIEITKNYRLIEFREDLKKLYQIAGSENRRIVFLFSDTQIKDEGFLEDINNILSSGVVPGLFVKDDLVSIFDSVRKDAVLAGREETPDELWRFFIDRVRSNLHIVLTMSPIGDTLRKRCRMYPGLVNCTTIDWFHTWPADALKEVALKFLVQVSFTDPSHREKISNVFADIHLSVTNVSSRMLFEMKRINYVTPTNYIELVKGYRRLLAEKSGELQMSVSKLGNGLAKLEDAKAQVETLSKELEVKKVVVAQSQRECEDLLVKIVSERRLADEQRKQVEADSERIGYEAIECKAISDDAEADLAIAMPALEKAMEEVNALDKGSISEVKAYTKPPELVETVLRAVMTLFGKATDWANAKKVMSESNFIQQIKMYDKDNISASTIGKIKKFVEDVKPDEVKKVSGAASALCVWVHAIYLYANVAKEVAPKRQRLQEASESLTLKQAALKDAQAALEIVIAQLAALQVSYDASVNQKNELRAEANMLEAKLDRAGKLVSGLSGEYIRWQLSIGQYNDALVKIYGDSVIAAAFLSYAGPFETTYRASLTSLWFNFVVRQSLPVTDNFNFATFLTKPTDVRDWNIQGLPKDDFSTENGVLCTRGTRWPLMIDPQGQANRWIRNLEGERLLVIDLKMANFLREIENAVQYGFPILLEDITEEIDAALEPVLSKTILKVGNREVIRIGDKEVEYSHDFRLYMTTKLSNPHYTPEISTKVTVVNFAVVKAGLEAQLLGIVVLKEEPKLEQQKSELTVAVANGKKQLVDLEDEILRLLSEAKGSLLDDEALVNTLQQSKTTAEEVTQQLIIAEETEKKIDGFRSGYRSAAIRASLAYFVLSDMGKVDPMYQFSLDAYVELFNMSIEKSHVSSLDISVEQRCEEINTYHTLEVYKYTCRGLFESHKLLFSLQLCVRIMESRNQMDSKELDFVSFGAGLVDISGHVQAVNPCKDWLPETVWGSLIELEKLDGFKGLADSIQSSSEDWKSWYMSGKPEVETMPDGWSSRTSELQKLCILRAFRIDRMLFGATQFISYNIGPEYVDPPSFDLKAIYDTSSNKTPLIFVLSPGVDPAASLFQLATQLNKTVENCALGQGQEPVAVSLIEKGIKAGNWVFLANCHLMLSWMPTLEKMVESFSQNCPHPSFRLWLSSSPDPHFPISILQKGVKMTTEPPKGIRSNMLTLYNTIGETQFSRCHHQSAYKKLLFCLAWFHAILLERRKFKSLGFNIPYDFNGSDFAICHDLIIVFLDEYPDRTPFDAMKYLIAEANYGGRVTDDWDRRLINVYIEDLVCEAALQNDKRFMLSELAEYFVPQDGDLKHYKKAISNMPQTDHPAAFGQHNNSSMAASIDDALHMLDVLISLQPRKLAAAVDDDTQLDPLTAQCTELLEQIPAPFDIKSVRERMASRTDPDPLQTVLYQELDRYNSLLATIRLSLASIVKVTQGIASVTPELEDVMVAVAQLKVPRLWGSAYPSLKLLGPWIRDLNERVQFFTSWVEDKLPDVWWLPAMTYPTSFLTAILQVAARANGLSIDSLNYETVILPTADKTKVGGHPNEGIYVSGISIEGATWNYEDGHLEDSRPMELISSMPIIHFKPVEGKKKSSKGIYTCPLYMYPIRSGTRERPSYVVSVDVKSGPKVAAEHWVKRGVAMLLSTNL